MPFHILKMSTIVTMILLALATLGDATQIGPILLYHIARGSYGKGATTISKTAFIIMTLKLSALDTAQCHLSCVLKERIMLCVVMLNVVMLNVVAPW